MSERIDLLVNNPFIGSPGDLLCEKVADGFKAVPQFAKVFGEFIDGYMRMDYGLRNLPALRFYSDGFTMEEDNWFIVGTVTADIILPPSVRRKELQNIPDILMGALLQQFRRQPFFDALGILVPSLNWLGQNIAVRKNLAFQIDEGNLVPMAQATINFRMDLREWDKYLQGDDRTVEAPFERTLKDLERVATVIHAQNADGSSANVDLLTTQNV